MSIITNYRCSGNHLAAISSNNEGCCHFYLGRPVVASWYFQNAFKLYDEHQASNKRGKLN